MIVPVKGEDYGLRENLAALGSLDYPDYELIVCAQCAADIPGGVLPRRAKVVLVHGGSSKAVRKCRTWRLARSPRATSAASTPLPIPTRA